MEKHAEPFPTPDAAGAASPSHRRWKPAARRVLRGFLSNAGWLVSAAALYLALRQISWSQVTALLRQADWSYLTLAVLGILVSFVGKAVRWQILLNQGADEAADPNGFRSDDLREPGRRKAPLSQVFMSHMSGQLLNLVFPARLGEVSRVYTIGALGLGRSFVLGTIVLEKIVDLLAYAGLFLCLLLLLPLPSWVQDSGYTFAAAALLSAAAAGFAAWKRDWLVQKLEALFGRLSNWRFSLGGRLQSAVSGRFRSSLESLAILRSRPAMLWVSAWSAVIWASALLTNYWTLLALDIHLPLVASLLVLIALQIGISVPAAPGRVGVFEVACILALSVYGVDQAAALGYGLVLHGVAQLPLLVFGLVSLRLQGLGLPAGFGRDRAAEGE